MKPTNDNDKEVMRIRGYKPVKIDLGGVDESAARERTYIMIKPDGV